jgi:hypothetical protein
MSDQKSIDSSVLQNVLKSPVTISIAKGAADMLIAGVTNAEKNAKKSYIENCMINDINIDANAECSKLFETYIHCKTTIAIINKLKTQTNDTKCSCTCSNN